MLDFELLQATPDRLLITKKRALDQKARREGNLELEMEAAQRKILKYWGIIKRKIGLSRTRTG